jgi:hypothetical protein
MDEVEDHASYGDGSPREDIFSYQVDDNQTSHIRAQFSNLSLTGANETIITEDGHPYSPPANPYASTEDSSPQAHLPNAIYGSAICMTCSSQSKGIEGANRCCGKTIFHGRHAMGAESPGSGQGVEHRLSNRQMIIALNDLATLLQVSSRIFLPSSYSHKHTRHSRVIERPGSI